MKLFLDDVRSTPTGWQRSETAWETIWFLEHETVTHLSLDHDLGDGPAYGEPPGNGNDVAKWIEEQAANGNLSLVPEFINCHSSNPKGKTDIRASIKSAIRFGAEIAYTEVDAKDLR